MERSEAAYVNQLARRMSSAVRDDRDGDVMRRAWRTTLGSWEVACDSYGDGSSSRSIATFLC